MVRRSPPPRWMSIRAHVRRPLLGLAVLALATSVRAQDSPRELTGTVQDRDKEPLKGAIVQLENESTNQVTSYITGPDGGFDFKRISGDSDYRVWATFRGRRSKNHELSHFDSNRHPKVVLLIKPED